MSLFQARNSFQSAQLCNADFSSSTVLANADLTSANLNRANLLAADATNAVFAGANLADANFANVKGINADFSSMWRRSVGLVFGSRKEEHIE
jgi:uncharacterized protein YjbI with pentapeptide repeats